MTKRLRIPLTLEDVLDMRLGEAVYLDGLLFTGRSLFHIRAIDQDIVPPLDYERMNVLLHIGPVMKPVEERWVPVSLDPTSSIRFEKYGPAVIKKLGLRAIIGKTTMGEDTTRTMKEMGCVHLTRVGVPGNILARRAKRVIEVHFKDELGSTEATWVMEVENFGPFLVDIDARGNNLFHQMEEGVDTKMKDMYKRFGVPEDFEYTPV